MKRSFLGLCIFIGGMAAQSVIADPFTDNLFGHPFDEKAVQLYFSKKSITENGSLPSVSSKFKAANGRINGAGFVLDVSDLKLGFKKAVITNAHLLQGEKKQLTKDIVRYDRIVKTKTFDIADEQTFFCAEHDIGIVNLDQVRNGNELVSFGRYNRHNNTFETKGMNNSPRGFYLLDDYGHEFPDLKNLNKRPMFLNEFSNELFHFYQMGNMYDLSCNYFPSSPETYDGNAIFIPVTTRRKLRFKDPVPFIQKIFNRPNQILAHRDRIQQNKCRIELSGELKAEQRVRKNFISDKLTVPAGIVPGMSGSPLLINENLNQKNYEIAGMVTTYDRRMQQSHFIAPKHITDCLKKFDKALKSQSSKKAEVTFNYSPEVGVLYRTAGDFVEIPTASGNAGAIFDSGFGGEGAAGVGGEGAAGVGGEGAAGVGGEGAAGVGGEGAAGNGGEGAAGNGGEGAAGNGGDLQNTIRVSSGLTYQGKHVIGFSCNLENQKFNIFANWEAIDFVKRNDCSPIYPEERLDLAKLIKSKNAKYKNQVASNRNLHSLKLKAKLKVRKGETLIVLNGTYYLKEIDEDISFKKTILLAKNGIGFNPFKQIVITEDDITNFFNDYPGGETLILDLTELYFLNLDKVYNSKNQDLLSVLERNNKLRIHGSLRYKENSKGSIPITLEWN